MSPNVDHMRRSHKGRTASSLAVQFYMQLARCAERRRSHLLGAILKDTGRHLLHHTVDLQNAIVGPDGKAQGSRLALPVVSVSKEKLQQLAHLADDLGSPFSLFIVGMGKFGKSTLLNALAGSRLAAMDVLPKTWKIDVYEAARPGTPVTLKFRDGSSRQWSFKEACAFIAEEERKREESEALIYKKFREDSPKISSAEAREELLHHLKSKYLYISPLCEVHWPCPRTGLLANFKLVDTPGLWQDYLPDDIRSSLSDYYHKADGVIWVLDAQKVSARKPRELMDDLQRALDRVGRRTGNIVAVLNRIDTATSSDPDAARKVVDEAYRLFGDIFSEIVPISALQALKAAESGDRDLFNRSGLADLLVVIDRRFRRNAVRIQQESKIAGAGLILRDIKNVAFSYRHKLEADDARRRQLQAEFEADLATTRQGMADMIEAALARYYAGVRSRIESTSEELLDADSTDRRAAILQAIAGKDELVIAVKDCATRIAHTMTQFAAVWAERSFISEFQRLPVTYTASPLPTFSIADPDIKLSSFDISDSKFNIGALMSLLGFGLLGPVGLFAGPVLSFLGVTGSIAKSRHLPRIKKELTSKFGAVTAEARAALVAVLDKHTGEVRDYVSHIRETSYVDLHGPPDKVATLRQCLLNIESQQPPSLEPVAITMRRLILEGRKKDADTSGGR